MTDTEIMNRIREAIAALDEALLYIPHVDKIDHKRYIRIQDAATALIEAREELQIRITVQDNARKAIERMSQ
jgi:quinolinate synthase